MIYFIGGLWIDGTAWWNATIRMAKKAIGPGDLVTVDLEGKLGQPLSVPAERFARSAERAIMRQNRGNRSQELSYQEFVLTPQC